MNSKKNESKYFEAVEAGRGPPESNGGKLLRLLLPSRKYIPHILPSPKDNKSPPEM